MPLAPSNAQHRIPSQIHSVKALPQLMAANQLEIVGLSDAAQAGVERFLRDSRESLGEELVAIVLYGGLVKGEYSPTTSDVNMMVILKDVTLASLDHLARPVERGRREFGLSVLVLSEEDLCRSTDVFPIKFLDMQRHHRILHGSDVLSSLDISRQHLRLRCEQEIRNLMLRLRQFYMFRADFSERLEITLTRAVSSFLKNLAVLVELKTERVPSSNEATLAAAGQFELNIEPLKKVMAMKRGELHLNANELKQLYESFMQTVRQAALIADRL